MTASPLADDFLRDEPDQVRDQVRQVLRHRLVIAVCLVAGVCGGALLAAAGSGTYEADGTVLVRDVSSSAFDSPVGVDNRINMQTEVQVAGSPLVTARAARALKEPGLTGPALGRGLVVSVSPDSQVLEFAYTGPGAAESARRANALMSAYLGQRQQDADKSLSHTVVTLQAQLKSLTSRYTSAGPSLRESLAQQMASVQAKLTDYQAVDTTPGQVLAKAVRPGSPAGAGTGLMLTVGGVAGAALGVLLAWLVSVLETGVRDERDVRRYLGAPVLAVLAAARGGDGELALPAGRTGETYRTLALRASLAADPDAASSGRRVLLVVEPRSAGHAAEVAAGLASAFSESGEDVLLIEADLRAPELTRRLARRLTGDGLDAQGRPRPPLRVDAGGPGAFFLVPGRATRAVGPALAEIEANAVAHRAGRTIVVRAPAVLEYPDALAVARWADGVVVVCPEGGLPGRELAEVAELFGPSQVPVLGAVLRRTGGPLGRRAGRSRTGAGRVAPAQAGEPDGPATAGAAVAGAGARWAAGGGGPAAPAPASAPGAASVPGGHGTPGSAPVPGSHHATPGSGGPAAHTPAATGSWSALGGGQRPAPERGGA